MLAKNNPNRRLLLFRAIPISAAPVAARCYRHRFGGAPSVLAGATAQETPARCESPCRFAASLLLPVKLYHLLLLLAALPLLSGAAASASAALSEFTPAQPVISDHRVNVKDYGAIGDGGGTVNTNMFNKALAAIHAAGGGILVVPPGDYFTGPLDLGSNTDLHLEAGAKLLFSPKFDDYLVPGHDTYRPLIRIANAHDVRISGQGTIDGNGEAWWPEARRFTADAKVRHTGHGTSPRPIMLGFSNCERICVDGVTLTNAPVFNVVASACADATFEGISILNPTNAPNTDGIDPKNCQRVRIAHCTIDTGDDNVALGGGAGPTEEDILITDCTFLHGHGCSIGSGTVSGVRRLLVQRCTFDGTDTGMRFKSARGRGGLVEDVTYQDLTMKNVGVAISVTSYYSETSSDSTPANDSAQPVNERTPHWRNIAVRNLIATSCRRHAGLVAGLPEMPVENVTLENITISAPIGLRITQTKGVTLKNVHVMAGSGTDIMVDASVQALSR